jgi:hypothetical protein
MAKQPKPRGRVFSRAAAAEYIQEATGVPFSRHTLRDRPIPFVIVNRHAVYLEDDLNAFIDGLFANAVRRMSVKPGVQRSHRRTRETAAI